MPDWFYRPVSRPLLFRLPAERSRDLALGFMGGLARLPLGGRVIDLLGHMRPDPRLGLTVAGVRLASPLALGPILDGRAVALPALARFGFGLIDGGRVALDGGHPAIERRTADGALWQAAPAALDLDTALARLREAAALGMPLLVRLAPRDRSELAKLVSALAPHAAMLAIDLTATPGPHDAELLAHAAAIAAPRPVLMVVAADLPVAALDALAGGLGGLAGVLVDGTVAAPGGGRLAGLPAREPARRLVAALRRRLGPGPAIVAGGGVHEPEDALALRQAGADVVLLDTGLVYSGPGLPKRANEALLHEATRDAAREPPLRAAESSWLWLLLMGSGMLAGSLLALLIAATRTMLPYDEHFVGLSRTQVAAVNARLLPFMTHDRVTLAGVMVSIGVLYVGLALNGVRRGHVWARNAIVASASVGFLSFFLFLGYGYLDPFHAFVTVVLLQFLLLGIHGRVDPHHPASAPPPREDGAWRRANVGQLLLVLHAAGLLAAGAVISAIGVTHVFVRTDLEFMGATPGHLHAASPFLVPLVAHDRATLGGMLLSSGAGLLLAALWGFRGGARWLWWTFLLAGIGAYGGVLTVHLAVGYTAPEHLAPVAAGMALYGTGLALSHGWLCRT